MKRKLLFLILLVGMALVGHAQKKDHEVMHREFKEFKVKFMAQEIDLNDKQRDKFYEVYSQMMDERDKVMRDAFRAQRKVKKIRTLQKLTIKLPQMQWLTLRSRLRR